jgi:plastocyanin
MTITSVSGTTVKVTRGTEDTKITEHTADALVTEQGNVIEVKRAQDGTSAASHDVKTEVIEIGDSIKVERAAFGTKDAEHPEGAEVFNGPILPGNTIIGEAGTVPCGQRAPVINTPAPAAVIEIIGDVEIGMGDNFFDLDGKRNPTLQIASGATVKVTVKNNGAAVHNLRTTGADGKFGTDDDQVTDPLAVPAGNTGAVEISFDKPGTYQYQCQFHPVDMSGEITVP